ncbi:glycosyltransferase [Akkermansiaceae bacterium]|nr:glycosyltransferase [Akkermansiaceae bacterium]
MILLKSKNIDNYVSKIEDWTVLPKNPIVTVQIPTYNHELFIRKALDSVLEQRVDFDYEILIREDDSSDKTREIVLEFQKKYPNKFRVWLAKKNLKRQGVLLGLNRFARGKYLAKLDGDDYWTDPYKLQKQFNFMQNNRDCTLVFHLANKINTKNKVIGFHGPKTKLDQCFFDIKDAIFKCDILVPTNSMFFETKYLENLPNWFIKAPVGDLPLTLLLAHHGKLGFINEVMSNYRVMSQGSWSREFIKLNQKRKIHDQRIRAMFKGFDTWTDYKYTRKIRRFLFIKRLYILRREIKLRLSSFNLGN